MKTNAFYNTIKYEGERLSYNEGKALAQEQLIREIFLANPYTKISPSQMLNIFNKKYDRYPPITSIRRAMTTLAHAKRERFLTKIDETMTGPFNEDEHFWILTDSLSTNDFAKGYFKGDFDQPTPAPKPSITQPELFQ